MPRKSTRYWDSCCFLGWLASEADKEGKCAGVIQKAQDGQLFIATSTLTIAEVLKLKGKPRLPSDREAELTAFFQNEWIILRDLTPPIAHEARKLVWYENIDPKDAIHVATALDAKLLRMDTFDTNLHKKDAKLGGNPPLRIGRPDLPQQLKMNWFEEG